MAMWSIGSADDWGPEREIDREPVSILSAASAAAFGVPGTELATLAMTR